MKTQGNLFLKIFEYMAPWLVLAMLLMYSYAKFFRHSYGFRITAATGLVLFVFDQQPEPTLQENDRIVQIGSVPWEDFQVDLSRSLFEGYKPGDIVPLTVERDGQTVKIDWMYPSNPVREEFLDQLISEWFIAYFFWLAGVLTILLVRPKDDSWLLMALFDFLTAIWLIAGSGLSGYHIWYSAIVLRVAVWLCVPVYLHLHWLFPRPLGKLPSSLIWTGYGVAAGFAIAQALGLLPSRLYILAFLLAVGGSLILLLFHIGRQRSIRRDFRPLFIVLLLSIVPAVAWPILTSMRLVPDWYGSVGILSLSLIPLAYFYAAFRRRLGNMELRVNRFFTIYMFVILLGIFGLLLLAFLDQGPDFPGKTVTAGFTSILITSAAFSWVYPPFETFMDRRVFGVSFTPKRLLETFSSEITTSISLPDLIHVLQEEVLPSLLIRQFVFFHYDQGSLNIVSRMGLGAEPLPEEKDVPDLLARSGLFRSAVLADTDQPLAWIRLALPLRLSDQVIGFWLLGRRDPDDFYSQQEVLTLTSLANLTAIALSNILQTERLTSMYQANISRYEQERVSWARDLHDIILNELAALPIRSDAPSFSQTFQEAYERVSEQLREIVNDLRPPMLVFGLKLALEAYAEKLGERNLGSPDILTDIQTDGDCRYSLVVESNLYRIVQEACENSLRYAHANRLSVTGRLTAMQIHLSVEDDGMGIDPQINLKLDDLLIHKHFGLAGMRERASVIGAELKIISNPNEGTQIHITWKSNESM